jgi:hypothetical protein
LTKQYSTAKKSVVHITEARQLTVLAAIMAHAHGVLARVKSKTYAKTNGLLIKSMNGLVTGDKHVKWMLGQITLPRNMKQLVLTIGNR